MKVPVPCRQCGRPYVHTREHMLYCSDDCEWVARARPCKKCGQMFLPESGNQRYCREPLCQAAAQVRVPGLMQANETRRAEAQAQGPKMVTVWCALEDCPKKQEPFLIPLSAHKAGPDRKHYHPDGCHQIWRAGHAAQTQPLAAAATVNRLEHVCAWDLCPRKHELISLPASKGPGPHRHTNGPNSCHAQWFAAGRPALGERSSRKGAILICQACGKEIGYRGPAQLDQKFCTDCRDRNLAKVGRTARKEGRKGEWRTCAHPGCDARRYQQPWKLKRYAGGRPYYCRKHSPGRAPVLPRIAVSCTTCAAVRVFRSSGLPTSVNRETNTWTCPACHQHKTIRVTVSCAHCPREITRRVKRGTRPSPKFCSVAHRAAYYATQRGIRVCRQCGEVIARTMNLAFCNNQCKAAYAKGLPRQVPSSAPPRGAGKKTSRELIRVCRNGFVGTIRELAQEAGINKETVGTAKKRGVVVATRLPDGRTQWSVAKRRLSAALAS